MDRKHGWDISEETQQEADDHQKALVLALVEMLLAQVRQSPVSRQQALAALDITKSVLSL